MTFEMALANMKAGKRVRQKSEPRISYEIKNKAFHMRVRNSTNTFIVTSFNSWQIFAKDWEVIE